MMHLDLPSSFTARVSCAALGAAILGTLAGAPAALGQSFQPSTTLPVLVNTVTDGGQENADVSTAESGFVIVWESDAEFNEKIVGQRFDENQNRVGEDFLVGAGEESFRQPAVARADDFVAVWEAGTSNQNILGQLFDDQGAPLSPTPGLVNLYTEDEQILPEVASDAQGNFVVVYQSFKWPGDGDGEAVVGRLYSANAGPLSAEFLINQVTEDDQEDPSVGRQPGGDFLVAWESEDAIDGKGIFARIFTADGEPKGFEFVVNTVGDGSQEFPSVGAWLDGYVVVFMSDDGEGKGIYARRFDSNGNPLDAVEFVVNNIRDLDQRAPAVAAFDSGGFVVVWEDDDFGVSGREFDANGDAVGGQFQVGFSDRMEERPRIATRDQGFLVTWYGAGDEPDNDVFARNYVLPEPGSTALGLAALSTVAVLARSRRSRS